MKFFIKDWKILDGSIRIESSYRIIIHLPLGRCHPFPSLLLSTLAVKSARVDFFFMSKNYQVSIRVQGASEF